MVDWNIDPKVIDWSKLIAPPTPPCPSVDMSMLGPDTPAWLRREVQRLVDLNTPLHTVVALGLLVRLWAPPTEPMDPSGQVVRLIRDIPPETMRYVERRARTMAMALRENFDPLDRDDLECVFAALCQRHENEPLGKVLHVFDKDLNHNRIGLEGEFARTIGEDGAERLAEVWHAEPMAWWADPDTWP